MNKELFIHAYMLLTITIFFIISLLFRKTITGFLALLIYTSIIAACLIGDGIDINYNDDILSILIVNFTLFFMIIGFRRYKISEIIDDYDTIKYIYIYKYISKFAFIGVIINLLILLSSLNQFMALAVSVEAYKNTGIAVEYLSNNRFGFLLSLSLIFSPFSYITFGYHFYFLSRNDTTNALKAILLSTNIFLINLVYLSRAGAVTFVLIYLAYWNYVKGVYPLKFRKRVRKIVFRIITMVVIILYLISYSRFSDRILIQEDSFIENPVVSSLLWYFSQWFENGIVLISRYNADLNLKGSTFLYVADKIKEVMGGEIIDIKILREYAFGDLATRFNGLPAVLVYDLGYIGAILFSVAFYFVVRRYSPIRGRITLKNLLLFSILIPIPIMFFQGNHFVSSIYNLAIIYMILTRILTRCFVKNRNSSEVLIYNKGYGN